MDEDDPWDWGVDRVVQELCTDNRTWPPLSATQLLPDPGQLEYNLREQEIDGSFMLTGLTHQSLKEEFGLAGPRSIKYRTTILHAISHFQGKSQSYSDYLQQHGNLSSRIYDGSNGGTTGRGRRLSIVTDKSIVPPMEKGVSSELPSAEGHTTMADDVANVHSTPDTEEPVSLKRILPTLISTDVDDLPQLDSEDASPGGHKKKKRRLAPTLITSVLDPDRNRDIPTAADAVRIYDPQNVEPGIVFTGDDGKKRMVPIQQDGIYNLQVRVAQGDSKDAMIAGGNRNLEAAKKLAEAAKLKDLLQRRPITLSDGYLGKQKFPVDNIFFSGVALGKELTLSDDEQDFSQSYTGVSAGRRLYVNGRMRRFLQSQPRVFKRCGKVFTAVIPYPARLKPMYQTPSFSLLQTTPDGQVKITREDLSAWSELNTEHQPCATLANEDERQANFNLPENLMLGGPSSYDNWDPEVELKKYRHADGGDEVLPLFGESDEDNEYDIETWREIEEENGKLEKPLIVSKKPPLSHDEVKEAIDEGIALLHDKWHSKQLPNRQRKAWGIWNKSRRLNNRRQQIRQAQQHLDRIVNDRLVKIRLEIHKEVWTTQKQIHRQCQIMEQSIFDREDLLWKISVLEQSTAPAKPTPVDTNALDPKKAKAPEHELEDDEEFIGSDSDLSSSIDELEGFIVSDEDGEHVGVHELCDTGDESDDQAPAEPQHINIDATATTEDDVLMRNADDEVTDINSECLNSNKLFSSPPSPQTPKRDVLKVETQSLPGLRSGDIMSDDLDNVVDLTILSDSPEIIDLLTPCKSVIVEEDSPLSEKVRKLSWINKTKSSASSNSTANYIASDTEMANTLEKPTREIPFTEPAAIAAYSHKVWEEMEDPSRLIIGVIHNMSSESRTDISGLLSSHSKAELWKESLEVMRAFRDGDKRVRGMNPKTFNAFTGVIRLFEMYSDCKKKLNRRTRLAPKVFKKLEENGPDKFPPFIDVCHAALKSYVEVTASLVDAGVDDVDDEDDEPLSAIRRRATRNSISEEETETPRKRARKVFENVAARQLREEDQQRQAEQEHRRQVLRERLAQSGSSLNADRAQIIVNESKFEHEGFVFIHDHIGGRIKNHQIDGIRFMWSQIVSKESSSQGCLLAHTMGLGKTMQVITLLVAIVEAANSNDPTVSSQIPKDLKQSRTLILSPPGLLDNWMDELLTWVPEDVCPKIGIFRKVDATVKLEVRLATINSWYQTGGVLLLGFEMFRNILTSRSNARMAATMDEETFEVVEKQLLEGPNIIIADEAHKLKNVSSALTRAATRFRSNTRIALTGSPLSNNVEEYHSMIEWIAPNYLGPIVEFRAKYVEPIQEGLYENSTRLERRKGLKMLEVLKEDIAPKVNRADSSVLKNDLKPKIEFVITVPLTDLQHKAYTLYVKSMRDSELNVDDKRTKSGKLRQTTIWSWIGILALLCNHPECFRNKITERKNTTDKESQTRKARATANGDGIDDIVAPLDVSQSLVDEVATLFDNYPLNTCDVDHSYKAKILVQILDASKKVGDKVLIFSQTLATLDYLENICKRSKRKYARLDGSTPMGKRQGLIKDFNTGTTDIYLISTTAGGLGLNLYGANRVIIFDFRWNPINEEQAVGRAYRIGQKKPVYVYRFIAGGTFEDKLHNKAVFKTQLSSQLVDKKNIVAWAKREKSDFLFEPRPVQQQDLSAFRGMDPGVLDSILDSQAVVSSIRGIVMTDTFNRRDDDNLTAEERTEVRQLLKDEKMKRSDPEGWQSVLNQRRAIELQKQQKAQDAYASQLKAFPGLNQINMGYGQPASQAAGQSHNANHPGGISPGALPTSRPTDANLSRPLPSPLATGSAILPSQSPRKPGRDPIMGSGTISIAEGVPEPSQSATKQVNSPLRRAVPLPSPRATESVILPSQSPRKPGRDPIMGSGTISIAEGVPEPSQSATKQVYSPLRRAVPLPSQSPRTSGRDPIMGSGTMSIAEGVPEPSKSATKQVNSPLRRVPSAVSLPLSITPTKRPREPKDSQELILKLKLALQQGDPDHEESSNRLANSFYKTLKRSSGDSYDLLPSWVEDMAHHFIVEDSGLREKLFSREFSIKQAITAVLGAIIKETPKPISPMKGASGSSASNSLAEATAATDADIGQSIPADALRKCRVRFNVALTSAFTRAVKNGGREVPNYINDGDTAKRIAEAVARELSKATNDSKIFATAIEVAVEEVRENGSLCTDLAQNKIQPAIFVERVLAKAKSSDATLTMDGGSSEPKVGQLSNSSTTGQSSDVRTPNKSILKSLSKFGSSFFS